MGTQEAGQRDGLGPTEAAKEERRREDLEGGFYDLDFAAHRCRRYHEKLTVFYGAWRNAFRVVTVLAGSSAFFVVVAEFQSLAVFITAFVGLWAILDIVWMPDKKHDLHNELCKRFIGLAAKIERAPRTEEALRELRAERLLIEQNEPPCKRLVDIEARNDELRARNFPPEMLAPLTSWQRTAGRYGSNWGLVRLEKWKAEQPRHS
ncbi:MAG: hypothetical protein KIT25_23295 [Enhydrobacter sp.]|nr:MAG: hypothetical protein KIT25_23295 [Enhydrobacter sp.]